MTTRTIAINEEAYRRLKKLKQPGDSFSEVILRELPDSLVTAGEILDYFEKHPVPKANPAMREAMLSRRRRRSGRLS
jgi:predicted CopG family antitoxin